MIRVLLVDDQALLRTGFRLVLEAAPDIEVVGEASCGNFFAQSLATTPLVARNSMSVVVFIVTTSAARPSFTARAWALEPQWAWSIFTSLPVVFL